MSIDTSVLWGGVIVCFFIVFGVYKNQHFLIFQHVKYRTVGAHEAIIGSIGLKRKTGKNRYELRFIPKWDNLQIINTTNFDKTLNIDFKLSLSGLLSTKSSADAQTENSLNMKGKYYLFRVADSDSLVRQLNNDRNLELRRKLSTDSNYRIITACITVYDQEMTERISKTAGVKFSLNSETNGSQSVDVSSQDNNLIKLLMSNGTIYAYEFSRICWRSEEEGGKQYEIVSIMADRAVSGIKGSDQHDCPAGQTLDYSNVKKINRNAGDMLPFFGGVKY